MTYEQYLMHHGILGQKWGIRRFQNEDGSLTSEGRRRYGVRDYKKERSALVKEGRLKSRSWKELEKIDAERAALIRYNALTGGLPTDKQKAEELDKREAYEMAKMETEAQAYADRVLNSKYGEQTIHDLKLKNKKMQNAEMAGMALATFGAITVASLKAAKQYNRG